MKFDFITSKANVFNRDTIVIKIIDNSNNYGFGEVVCFSEAFYTSETIDESLKVLENEYVEKLLGLEIENPFEIHNIIDFKYPMTKAAIEFALVDLYCRKNNLRAVDFLFSKEKISDYIDGGMVLGDMPYEKLKVNIERYLEEGYRRFKIKIKPIKSFENVRKLTEEFPNIDFLLDANRSFLIEDIHELKEYDKLKLLCIEEPIEYENFEELAFLQKELSTSICLDEGILTIEMLKEAIRAKAFKLLNIKAARMGGIYYAYEAIKLCRKNNIKFWMGSMIENSIGKMVQANLARIHDNFFAGDLSSNSRYFEDDLIIPPLEFNNGKFTFNNLNGFGYEVDEEKLKQNSIYVLQREV